MRQKTRRVLNLRRLRRDKEMTQAQLGQRVGLATSFISEIESGKKQPSLDSAQDLAAVFGVTVDEAFKYVELEVVS
jgi:transcriptional regulator with XRE-family HTH domain